MSLHQKIGQNNFDLIRLFAALQVVLVHAAGHLHVDLPGLTLLGYFPGVPIFFFISGYLIYQSYANIQQDRLRRFFLNRFLRLFPGLWVCLLVSIAVVYGTGYFETVTVSARQFMVWLAAQASILQFYNPEFLRGFGIGVLNGSLWTISVEIQFYILTPLVFLLFRTHRALAGAVFVLMVIINALNTHFNEAGTLAGKLLNVSFLPWWSMFLLGAWLSTREDLQQRLLRVPFWAWLLGYLLTQHVAGTLGAGAGNGISIVAYAVLVGLVVKAAFTRPELANQLLHRNDFSYGIYIYHMVFVNLAIELGYLGSLAAYASTIAATLLVSALSWFLVEKPALALKKSTLRRYARPGSDPEAAPRPDA
jgi:peptidoglycan/LPS O-acetylase OafA/YrhL